MRKNNQKGFTLLELIVVVLILMALAAIAIPQYSSYRGKAEKAAVISDCRTLYRGFVLYYMEQNMFPFAADDAPINPADIFNVTNLNPLTNTADMGGLPLGIDVPRFMSNIDSGQAEIYDSPDADDQTFFVVLPWKNDPSIKFVIAQADNVTYGDGTTLVDSGNYLDGVYVTKGGNIIQ